MFDKVLPTALVGSYPQPDWLADKAVLMGGAPPRVRMKEVWRIPEDALVEAQDDAILSILHDQERAGLDIACDGEVRRESYFNAFANALDGIDLDNPGEMKSRTGRTVLVPRVVGPISRRSAVHVRDIEFLRANTDKPLKITLPGAFTMARLAKDEFYGDQEKLIMAYAAAVNEELRDLAAAGADVVQIDEPYMQANPEDAALFGVQAIDAALDGVPAKSVVHVCFGYAHVVKDKPSGYSFLSELDACRADALSIEAAQPGLDPEILERLPNKNVMFGVLDLSSHEVETPELIADRLRGALRHIPADRLIVAPDCGMKYLPRAVAFGKMKAMVDGAAIVRAELA